MQSLAVEVRYAFMDEGRNGHIALAMNHEMGRRQHGRFDTLHRRAGICAGRPIFVAPQRQAAAAEVACDMSRRVTLKIQMGACAAGRHADGIKNVAPFRRVSRWLAAVDRGQQSVAIARNPNLGTGADRVVADVGVELAAGDLHCGRIVEQRGGVRGE